MKAELVPENGDPPITITRDVTVVGRHVGCDVVIPDPSLSKRHCVFVKTDGLLVLRDLATTNGTKVKGQRVRWAALLPDDKISLGAYKMRVYLGSDEMPAPSEQRRSRLGQGEGALKAAAAFGPRTERMPPSQLPAAALTGFPPPSSQGLEEEWESADAVGAGLASPQAAPAGGFEIVEESARFELIDDDDDEIIELE
jgi:pSer/pThr/pTyr-binding forkhead associated (FHA) protein